MRAPMFAVRLRAAAAALLLFLGCALDVRASDSLPTQLSDQAYWALIERTSEKEGVYPTGSFISNELGFQEPMALARSMTQPGGAFLGVGPEQNFSYIAALRPGIAFIIDIRRQNLLNHLFYKALFELSPDRAAFLGRLFCSETPPGLTQASSVDELLSAYASSPRTPAAYVRNRDAVIELLKTKHGFPVSVQDLDGIERIQRAFFQFGQDITYDSELPGAAPAPQVRRASPSYAALARATDRQGIQHGFLASEQSYRVVRDLELRNLVVPVVGDFAGPEALRTIGAYLREHQAAVTVFYTSNVERYLLQQPAAETPNGGWKPFIENVESLPRDGSSLFIRVPRGSYADQSVPSVLQRMEDTLQAVRLGRIRSRADLFAPVRP